LTVRLPPCDEPEDTTLPPSLPEETAQPAPPPTRPPAMTAAMTGRSSLLRPERSLVVVVAAAPEASSLK
jgi:hypothetical protein